MENIIVIIKASAERQRFLDREILSTTMPTYMKTQDQNFWTETAVAGDSEASSEDVKADEEPWDQSGTDVHQELLLLCVCVCVCLPVYVHACTTPPPELSLSLSLSLSLPFNVGLYIKSAITHRSA